MNYFYILFIFFLSCQQKNQLKLNATLSAVNTNDSLSMCYKKSIQQDNLNYESFYIKYIRDYKLNIEQVDGDSLFRENFTTYLGRITDSTNQTNFHVLKQFWTLQMAISKKGHSDLIFIDTTKKVSFTYSFNMPNELPFKLKNNYLYYKMNFSIDSLLLDNYPPKILCTPNNNCVEY